MTRHFTPGLIVLTFVLAGLCGCATGWDHQKRLNQLFKEEADGSLTLVHTIEEKTLFSYMRGFLVEPLGWKPTYALETVEDPSQDARETIQNLTEDLPEDPLLIARSLPLLSRIALHAPFNLTRAQAVLALRQTLQQALPVHPPLTRTVPEDAAAIDGGISGLLNALKNTTRPLTPATILPLLDRLIHTDYKTLALTGRSLMTLGILYVHTSTATAGMRPRVVEGIQRLGRTLCRFTLLRAGEDKGFMVREAVARTLGEVGAPWAVPQLLKMLAEETDTMVLRKVFRSLEAYRTPPVARALVAIMKKPRRPLSLAMARRALTAFTREDLGPNPVKWEQRLQTLGYR